MFKFSDVAAEVAAIAAAGICIYTKVAIFAFVRQQWIFSFVFLFLWMWMKFIWNEWNTACLGLSQSVSHTVMIVVNNDDDNNNSLLDNCNNIEQNAFFAAEWIEIRLIALAQVNNGRASGTPLLVYSLLVLLSVCKS